MNAPVDSSTDAPVDSRVDAGALSRDLSQMMRSAAELIRDSAPEDKVAVTVETTDPDGNPWKVTVTGHG